jgi:hypothetical protein
MYGERRVRLAKALRRDGVPDPVWGNLLERDLVQDYEKGEFELEYLIDQTRIQLKTYNKRAQKPMYAIPVEPTR